MQRTDSPSKPICCRVESCGLTLETPVLVLLVLSFPLLHLGGRPSAVFPSLGANPVAEVTMKNLEGYRRAPDAPPPLWIQTEIQETAADTRVPRLALAVLNPHVRPQLS